MRTGYLFANGSLHQGEAVKAALTRLRDETDRVLIAVDGGLRHLLARGLHPDLLIGDLDSADPAAIEAMTAQGVPVVRFPMEKDETDLELGLLAAVERGCKAMIIFGGIGDRFDQTISNVYLLALPALRSVEVCLLDANQTIRLLLAGETTLTGQVGDTISLIPLSAAVSGIVTDGLRYPLRGESLQIGPARGVSNVIEHLPATVRFTEGLLLLVHTVGRA